MAQVTIPLPAPVAHDANSINWTDINNGLGLVTGLRVGGATSHLTRLLVRADNINSELRVGDSLPDNLSTSGQELVEGWETNASAITLQNDHIATDAVLPGPNNSDNTNQDATEFYSWRPSSTTRTPLGTWITAWRALTSAQQGDTRVILDDGAAPAVVTGDAGSVSLNLSTGSATGFATAPAVRGDAGTVSMDLSVGSATGFVPPPAVDPTNFSATGTIHMLMHIRTGNHRRGNDQENLWASASWTNDGAAGQVGTILSGDADITDDVTLARFARWDRSATDKRLILNAVGEIGALFDEAADVYRLTLVRAADSVITVGPPSGETSDRTFVDWRLNDSTLSQAMWDALAAIQNGDDILLSVHEGTAAYGLPVASAPTPTINPVSAGDEGTDVTLSAVVPPSDSTNPYDTVTYAWSVSGGTLDDPTAVMPVWTRPQVSADTNNTIGLQVAVHGNGTNARAGTNDFAAAPQVTSLVRNVVPVITGTAGAITMNLSVGMATGRVVAPPAITTAIANGNVAELIFNTNLDDTSVPAPSDFVFYNGDAQAFGDWSDSRIQRGADGIPDLNTVAAGITYYGQGSPNRPPGFDGVCWTFDDGSQIACTSRQATFAYYRPNQTASWEQAGPAGFVLTDADDYTGGDPRIIRFTGANLPTPIDTHSDSGNSWAIIWSPTPGTIRLSQCFVGCGYWDRSFSPEGIVGVRTVEIIGNILQITLARNVPRQNDDTAIDYTPGANPLRTANAPVGALSRQALDNRTPVTRQTLTLPAPDVYTLHNRVQWSSLTDEIRDGLLDDPAEDGIWDLFDASHADAHFRIQTRIGSDPGSDPGPQLSLGWLRGWHIRFIPVYGHHVDLAFDDLDWGADGPGDDTEPYQFDSLISDLQLGMIATAGFNAAGVRLRISDGPLPDETTRAGDAGSVGVNLSVGTATGFATAPAPGVTTGNAGAVTISLSVGSASGFASAPPTTTGAAGSVTMNLSVGMATGFATAPAPTVTTGNAGAVTISLSVGRATGRATVIPTTTGDAGSVTITLSVGSATGVSLAAPAAIEESLPGWTLELGPDSQGTTQRIWDGAGELDYGGETWQPAVGEAGDLVLDGSPPAVTVTLAIAGATARAAWVAWEGSVPAKFQLVRKVGDDWMAVGPEVSGVLSDPQLEMVGDKEQVELPIRSGVTARVPQRTWSHEDQQQRVPGDIGFEQLKEAATVRGSWPG